MKLQKKKKKVNLVVIFLVVALVFAVIWGACELIRHLSAYTGEIVAAAQDYDPARITRYVITLANLFHKFYNACRVKGEEEALSAARLTLCTAASTVICNVLTMFKITAPESM